MALLDFIKKKKPESIDDKIENARRARKKIENSYPKDPKEEMDNYLYEALNGLEESGAYKMQMKMVEERIKKLEDEEYEEFKKLGITREDYNLLGEIENSISSAENEEYKDFEKLEKIRGDFLKFMENNPKLFVEMGSDTLEKNEDYSNIAFKRLSDVGKNCVIIQSYLEYYKKLQESGKKTEMAKFKSDLKEDVNTEEILKKVEIEEKKKEYIKNHPYAKILDELMEYANTKQFYGTSEESVFAQYKIASIIDIRAQKAKFVSGAKSIFECEINGEKIMYGRQHAEWVLKVLHRLGIIDLSNNLSEFDHMRDNYLSEEEVNNRTKRWIIEAERLRDIDISSTELPEDYKKYIHEGNLRG